MLSELASGRRVLRATSLIKLVMATNLFFMRQYFLTIPKDFEEAAKLDSAGLLQDVLEGDAAARRAGDSAAVTILSSRGSGTSSSGR